MKAAVPSGDHCSFYKDCTSLECSTSTLGFPLRYNVTILKCHDPVQLVVEAAGGNFHWQHTFEGEQTVPIKINLPTTLSAFTPKVHVVVKKVTGGVEVSAELLIEAGEGYVFKRVPILDKETIPLDTSDCPSTGPYYVSGMYQPTSGSDLSKFLDILKNLANEGFNPLGQNGKLPSLPSSPLNGSSPELRSLMKLLNKDPAFQSCIQKLQGFKLKDLKSCYCIPSNHQSTAYTRVCGTSDVDRGKSNAMKGTKDTDNTDDKSGAHVDSGKSNAMKGTKDTDNTDDKSGAHVDSGKSNAMKGRKDTDSTDDGDSNSKYFIIGGCIAGAIVVTAIILSTVYVCMKRKRIHTTGGMSYSELKNQNS
jgi:hypothetical protein